MSGGVNGGGRDPIHEFSKLDAEGRRWVLDRLALRDRYALTLFDRPWLLGGQVAPPGEWRVWLIRAGRGWGKTRAGAEWVRALANGAPETRIALVGGTMDDARAVMVEGASGLIATARPGELKRWQATIGELEFANGSLVKLYSAEAPEKLRGWGSASRASRPIRCGRR